MCAIYDVRCFEKKFFRATRFSTIIMLSSKNQSKSPHGSLAEPRCHYLPIVEIYELSQKVLIRTMYRYLTSWDKHMRREMVHEAKEKCPISGHRSASKSVRWRAFFASREIRDTFYTRGPNFPINYTKSMVAKRGLTNSGKRSYPYVKKHGRIPIDPAIVAAIGHRFISKTKTIKKPTRARPETGDSLFGQKWFF